MSQAMQNEIDELRAELELQKKATTAVNAKIDGFLTNQRSDSAVMLELRERLANIREAAGIQREPIEAPPIPQIAKRLQARP